MEKVRVAIDCMGGDNAPQAPIEGALAALSESQEIIVQLVGREDVIQAALSGKTYDRERVEIYPASEVIETAEHPVSAINTKKDSSMVVGLKRVKEGQADAFLSAGNSGALLVGGQVVVGRIRGIKRAPFGAMIPTEKGASLLVDTGANVDARPDQLVAFAKLGVIYMEEVIGKKNPTVGLVNIGAEEEKGNALVKETMPLLKEVPGMNFIGSAEARDIPSGVCDILVCDAFVGNVIIKMYEGVAKSMMKALKKGLTAGLPAKIGAALALPSLKKSLKAFDISRYGGAPLLGVRGLVMKTHGSATANEFKNSILQCISFTQNDVVGKIEAMF